VLGSPVPLDATGAANSASITTLGVGPHAVSAAYAGGGSFLSSAGSVTQIVQRAETTTSVASDANPSVFGHSVSLTATVKAVAPGVGTSTGGMQFTIDGANYGAPVSFDAIGVATTRVSALTAGTHRVAADLFG